jgi:hypothetical protein
VQDYLDDDIKSDDPVHSGTLEIELFPAPAPAPAKAAGAPAAAKAAGGGGQSTDARGELDEIELFFKEENITVKLDFDATWEQAQAAIAKAMGRQVFFSWVDGDDTVVVDTPEEFEDLFAELEDDWDDPKGSELNGRMEVKVVEKADASGEVTGQQRKLTSASRTPSGAATPAAAEGDTATWAEAASAIAADKVQSEGGGGIASAPAKAAGGAEASVTPVAAAKPTIAASPAAARKDAAPVSAAGTPAESAAPANPAAEPPARTPAAQSTAAAATLPAPAAATPSTPVALAAAAASSSALPPASGRKQSPSLAPVPPPGGRPASSDKPPARAGGGSAAAVAGAGAESARARGDGGDGDDFGDSPPSAHAAKLPSGKKPQARTSAGRQMMTTEDSEVESGLDAGPLRRTAPARKVRVPREPCKRALWHSK